tara:strand:+ start:88 stop:255 length:168 start_codon:yes stop_codon:yes gene_type:complete
MLIGYGELNADAAPIVILSEAKYLIDPSAMLRMTCARFRMTLVGFRITLTIILIA